MRNSLKAPIPKFVKEGETWSVKNLSLIAEGDWSKKRNRQYTKEDIEQLVKNYNETTPVALSYLTHEGRIKRVSDAIVGITDNVKMVKGEKDDKDLFYFVADIVGITDNSKKQIEADFPFRSAVIEHIGEKKYFKGADFISEKPNHNNAESLIPPEKFRSIEINSYIGNENTEHILQKEGETEMKNKETKPEKSSEGAPKGAETVKGKTPEEIYTQEISRLTQLNIEKITESSTIKAELATAKSQLAAKTVEMNSLLAESKRSEFAKKVEENKAFNDLSKEKKDRVVDILISASASSFEMNDMEGKKVTLSASDAMLELMSFFGESGKPHSVRPGIIFGKDKPGEAKQKTVYQLAMEKRGLKPKEVK